MRDFLLREDSRATDRFLRGQLTYPVILAGNGYTCGMSGKWRPGDNAQPQAGFTYWRTIPEGGGARPFFLYSPYFAPHTPYDCQPETHRSHYRNSLLSKTGPEDHTPRRKQEVCTGQAGIVEMRFARLSSNLLSRILTLLSGTGFPTSVWRGRPVGAYAFRSCSLLAESFRRVRLRPLFMPVRRRFERNPTSGS